MNNLAYTAGTVSIPAGSLIATGAGVVWTDLRVQPFGFLWVPDTGQVFGIDTVTDATHLALINKNAGAAISAKPYVIISFPSEMQDSLNLQAIRAFLATASIVIYRTSDPTAGDGVDGTACIVNDGTNPLRVFTKAAGAWTRQRFEVRLTSYTVSTVPSAATAGAGTMIYVSNETGGAVPAFSDGTSWRRVTDRAVIS